MHQRTRKMMRQRKRCLLLGVIVCFVLLNMRLSVLAAPQIVENGTESYEEETTPGVLDDTEGGEKIEEDVVIPKEEEISGNIPEEDGVEESEVDIETKPDETPSTEENTEEENPEESKPTSREYLDKLAEQNREVLNEEEAVIAPASKTEVVFDLQDGKKEDGTAIQLQRLDMTEEQRWKVIHDEKGYVTFRNARTGKVLDVQNGVAKPCAKVQLYTANESWAQKWIVVPEENAYRIVSALDAELVLDARNGVLSSGTLLQLYTGNGTEAQRWAIRSISAIYKGIDAVAEENREVIKDGTYVIHSKLAGRRVLDVANGSTKDLANIRLYTTNMTAAQRWKVSHDEQGYVTFTNIGSEKVIDTAGGLAKAGTNVAQYRSNATRAQKWIVLPAANGGYQVISALGEGLCLDVTGASLKNGANMQIYEVNGSNAQSFDFLEVPPKVEPCEDMGISEGWYEITPFADEKLALDIAGGSQNNGANVQLYSRNSTYAQLFRLSYEDGYYRIVCALNEKALDIDGGNVVPGVNVQQWEKTGIKNNQLFSLSRNEDGSYTFINVATGLALDVTGGRIAQGANIQGWTPNQSQAQRFRLQQRTNFLTEGIFTISSALSDNMCLDIAGGTAGEGGNVQLWSKNNSSAQKWKVTAVEGQENTYTLEALVSGKMLTADESGNACQRKMTGGEEQWWRPDISKGCIVLRNAAKGTVLDVTGANRKNGTNIQCYEANGTVAQRFRVWRTTPLSSGIYIVRSFANSSWALDVASASRAAGANIQMWSANYSGAQKWSVSVRADGLCTFENVRCHRMLDVSNGTAVSGTNVKQWSSNGSNAQKWYVEYAGGGAFKIISALDRSLVLDIAGGKVYNGANVQIYTDNATIAQRFTFEATTYEPEPVNLAVPCVRQYPELPNGCESVALTNVLQYYGYLLGKTEISDQYIPQSSWDFVTAFWGNPRNSSGNCCSAPAITNAANRYLAQRGSGLRAYDVTGTSLQNLYYYLEQGNPVIIWSSINQAPLGPCYASQWYNGKLYHTYTNSHTVVLKGCDRRGKVVYLSDSISGYLTEAEGWMNLLYAGRGFQAVVIR